MIKLLQCSFNHFKEERIQKTNSDKEIHFVIKGGTIQCLFQTHFDALSLMFYKNAKTLENI